MDILIFGGQSNMQGQTECLPEENFSVEGAVEYKYLSNEAVPLLHPVGEDVGESHLLGAHLGHGSLIPDFCRAYIDATGHQVMAIHASCGGTAVEQWQKGEARYESAVKKILGGIKLAEETEKVNHIYFMWLQGESDAIMRTSLEDYKTMMIKLKDDLCSDTGIEKFCIIEVGYFCSTVSWITDRTKEDARSCDEVIMQAQEELCNEDGFAMLTDICKKISLEPEYISPFEEGHYNNKAMKLIGETAGRALAELL